MAGRKHRALRTVLGFVLLLGVLVASSLIVVGNGGARIVVFHVEPVDSEAGSGASDVYIQRNAVWDVNIDIYNRTGQPINDIEIVLEGHQDIGSTYGGDVRVSSDDENTLVHWNTDETADGEKVHIGFDCTSGGGVTILAIHVTWNGERVASLPPVGWVEGPDGNLVVRNPSTEPIMISGFRDGVVRTPIPLEYLSAPGLDEMDVNLTPISFAPLALGPGEEVETPILIGVIPAPAASLWGLAFLALVPPGGYVFLRWRRRRSG